MSRTTRTILLGVAIAILLSIIGGIIWWYFTNRPAAVEENGCRRDGLTPAHTIVLIDQSDPFSTDDIDWVNKLLDDQARGLPQYSLITVMGLTGEPYKLKVVPSLCSPGSPNQVNSLTGNVNLVDLNWGDNFQKPLYSKAREIMEAPSEARSPIAEAIDSIARRSDFSPKQPGRRLLIISDMIQNSAATSFFRGELSFSNFLKTSPGQELPDLRGVEVTTHLVRRHTVPIDRDRIRSFWTAYAGATGAELAFE